ncbi:MAG: potassium channel protein [Proteobacteria bacterium]|nr:potassium channel protein [Pseudomonadota bacterium]
MLPNNKHLLLNRISQTLKNSGLFKATIGFIAFLIIAAAIMLILESPESESGINDFFHSLWFSIVTVTTVGYGDLSPLSSLGKMAAIIIMFIGIAYSGVLTGNITSWLVERNVKKDKGLVPAKGFKKHILVLGWKENMAMLLKKILHVHNKTSDQLVLVNSIDSSEINELRQDPLLKDLYFFSGDYSNKEVLKNVCINEGERILIVAHEGVDDSHDEIDFKTVLAAIAVSKLNPGIHLTVEIIQPKFKQYLQHVKVDEVVLNHLNSRALLCNIGLMPGFHNLYKSLFEGKSGRLKIYRVSRAWVGLTIEKLREEKKEWYILGVIENTGDLRVRKREKMEEVQKSTSISKSIQGLNALKKMKSNRPVLYPNPEYVVEEHSAIIYIEKKACDLVNLQKTLLKQDPKDVSTKKGSRGDLFICGWKKNIYEILDYFYQQVERKDANWDRIVVISKVNKELATDFEEVYKNKPVIQLVKGDFVDQNVLLKAGIKKASEVIILAETSSEKTNDELDAQTVLTAMMVSNCNKKAYKIAEILDGRYKEALEQANVEEIVAVDALYRTTLSDATLGNGMSRVLRELINFSDTQIEFLSLTHEFVDREFEDLVNQFSRPGKLILGLLEDRGNLYVRKSERIQRAQIKPKIAHSVTDLKKVSDLVPNKIV